jgi:hypothetical protein
VKGISEGGRSVGGEQNVCEDILLCIDTLLCSYVVQHDHMWSKNPVSKPWISIAPETGDTECCKVFRTAFLHA